MKRFEAHINATEGGVITWKRFFSMTFITVWETDSGLIIIRAGDFGEVWANVRLKLVLTGPGQTIETSMPSGFSSW